MRTEVYHRIGKVTLPQLFIAGEWGGGRDDGGLGGGLTLHKQGKLEGLLRTAGALNKGGSNEPTQSWRKTAFADIISDEEAAALEASKLMLRQGEKSAA